MIGSEKTTLKIYTYICSCMQHTFMARVKTTNKLIIIFFMIKAQNKKCIFLSRAKVTSVLSCVVMGANAKRGSRTQNKIVALNENFR